MRALVSIRPFHGHLHPVAPVAAALRGAGHETLFATHAGFCDVVSRSGFDAQPAGLDPWDGDEFGFDATARKTSDLLRIASDWRPDVVLRDPTDFGALVAAEALDVPHVTVGFSRFMPRSFWSRVIGPVVEAVRARHGVAPDPELERLFPWLYLDTVPPWFQRLGETPPAVLRSVRPTLFEAPPPAGVPAFPIPSGPAVLATLGTVYNRADGLLGRLCRGAARVVPRVLCTTGPGADAARSVGPQPPGVQTAEYVPFSSLMPHCVAMVGHGGYNSVLSALLHGVPPLVLPLGSDHDFNAARCVELGAGLAADARSLTEERVEQLVRRLVEEPQFAAAASGFAEATAALPDVSSAVGLIEAVA